MNKILITFLVLIAVSVAGYFSGIISFNSLSKIPLDTKLNNGTTTDTNIPIIASKNILNLSSQNLTKAPDYIFNQRNLQELNLSNNLIGGALQSQINNLQNLKVLNLSNNKFTGVPAEIGQLKNLEILNLSNNSITGLPNELGNLSNLKVLDLSGNNYSEMDLDGIRKSLPASTIIKTK